MSDKLILKNKKTNKMESIAQHELEEKDWGFSFFVDDEMSAYKAAYQYRNSPHGCVVEFAQGAQQWMVTVFNQTGANMGLDNSKK